MHMVYQKEDGSLCRVFPGEKPEKAGILNCSKPEPKAELFIEPNVFSLKKFSEAARSRYKLRVVLERRNRPLRVAICGNKDAGKDKLANCVKSMMPNRSVEIVSISRDVLLPIAGETIYDSKNPFLLHDSYEQRDLCRQFWYDVGESITQIDPSFLVRYAVRERDDSVGIFAAMEQVRSAFLEVQLITGIRGEHELDAAMSEGLLDFSVYVSRKGTEDATNKIKPNKTDVVFNNSGTVHDMRERVSRLIRALLTSVE